MGWFVLAVLMLSSFTILGLVIFDAREQRRVWRRKMEYEEQSIKTMKDFERALNCANLTGRPQPIGRDECMSPQPFPVDRTMAGPF